MDIKGYWDKFYSKEKPPEEPSSFAIFIAERIKDGPKTLVDIGCGNGRDSRFFKSKGHIVTGIDVAASVDGIEYVQCDLVDVRSKANVYYCRFVVHAIEESKLDALLKNLHDLCDDGSILCIETRSIRGIAPGEKAITFFNSGIGEAHQRLHYSLAYLMNKIEKFGYSIDYALESKGLSIYKQDDPYLIRLICKRA